MNEASWDRIGRVVAGLALIALGAFTFSGVGAIVSVAVGLILLVTGAIGWCPIYATFRTGTRSTETVS